RCRLARRRRARARPSRSRPCRTAAPRRAAPRLWLANRHGRSRRAWCRWAGTSPSRGRSSERRCGSPQSSCFTRTLAPLWWSRPGVVGSTEAVEAEGAAGEHLVLRLGGQRPEPLAQHLRRAREEAVRVRIIGGPHDLVRPDIVGQHGDAALDRLERDPAIALEQLARPRLRRGLVETQVIEVPVHAVPPRRDLATTRLEKPDAQSLMTVEATAPNHTH